MYRFAVELPESVQKDLDRYTNTWGTKKGIATILFSGLIALAKEHQEERNLTDDRTLSSLLFTVQSKELVTECLRKGSESAT